MSGHSFSKYLNLTIIRMFWRIKRMNNNFFIYEPCLHVMYGIRGVPFFACTF